MSDVTRILERIEQGDPQAAEKLLPLVYDELRKLAAAKLAQENPGQTLQATALVHEAYLRLVTTPEARNQEPVASDEILAPGHRTPATGLWHSRGHFFAAAAEAMRRILVDVARRKQSQRHGGEFVRGELAELAIGHVPQGDQLLDLDESLSQLAAKDS